MPTLSILLLVRSLETGGAERQLVQLALGLRKRGHTVRVGVFYRRGPLAAELEREGIEIVDLRKTGRWDLVRFYIRTVKALRHIRPDIVYSFLGGANIVAAAAGIMVPGTKIVWSVRSSELDFARYDWLYRMAARLERRMSRMPSLIIANSRAGRDVAIRHGFPSGRMELVFNGIDTGRFGPDPVLRMKQRRIWGLEDEEIAIGVLGRLHPLKGQATFLLAAAIVVRQQAKLRFLCIGEGPDDARLKRLAAELNIDERVMLTGGHEPVSALNAIDIACSPSVAEGFSNSIAEAMACGVPCVVTDVGDSASIVGDTGTIVAPSDPDALAAALLAEIARVDPRRRAAARARIVENYSVSVMVERTLELLLRAPRNPN